jgi:SulP family sulfate permease
VRIRQIAEAHSARLVLTSIPENIREQLNLGGFWEDEQCVCFHSDLDHGLQWCEDRVIEGAGISSILRQPSFQEWLVNGGFNEDQATRFIEYLERLEFKAGEYLIRQGDESKDIFFIEKGQVSIYLENEG